MKNKLTFLTKSLVLLTASLVANMSWASSTPTTLANDQEQTTASASEINETATTPVDDIEVVAVVGKYPLVYFKRKMEEAELDFYDIFNSLADENKFKVQCRRQNRLGSNIKDKVCHPQFVLDRMAQETQAALQTGAPFPSWDDINFVVQEERAESLAYVERKVAENPHLRDKLIALNIKQAEYESQKNKSR